MLANIFFILYIVLMIGILYLCYSEKGQNFQYEFFVWIRTRYLNEVYH